MDNINSEPKATEDILGTFFKALAGNDIKALQTMHIPRSEVFYIRQKYYQDTGEWVSLDRMERSMYLEGLIDGREVHEPKRKRSWE
jgi:uncharacterized protein HemY|tara:strand:+ start:397 stop:654 length:258 start_codon:yes stop_codon:yes gene_type:complete